MVTKNSFQQPDSCPSWRNKAALDTVKLGVDNSHHCCCLHPARLKQADSSSCAYSCFIMPAQGKRMDSKALGPPLYRSARLSINAVWSLPSWVRPWSLQLWSGLSDKNRFWCQVKKNKPNNTIGSKYVQYPPGMGQQWRQPLVNQVAPNQQNPNQGCAPVPDKQGPSLPPISHEWHSSLRLVLPPSWLLRLWAHEQVNFWQVILIFKSCKWQHNS